MKKISLLMAAAALTLSVASCQKEFDSTTNDSPVFTARIAGMMDTKTVLTAENKVNWEKGDSISINGVIYVASPLSDGTLAIFSKDDIEKEHPNAPFYAFYPAAIGTGASAEGILPAEQKYDAGKITNVPMFAESTTNDLSFKNICAVLAITVKSTDISAVKSIKVSSSNCALSGAFTVTDGQTAVLTNPTATANTVTLTFKEAAVIPEGDSTVFYISIPAQTYKNLRIEISADGKKVGKIMQTVENAEIAVSVNTVYPISFKANYKPILLTGKFSVGTHKKVQFTRGNLWYGIKAPSTMANLHFEKDQTDRPTSWDTNHIGHFFWTKNVPASIATSYYDGACSTSDKPFFNELNGGLTVEGKGGYYALTHEEWVYLFRTRSNASNLRYHPATVNGVQNCILFAPDNFDTTNWKKTGVYTLDEIDELELVCLPRTGIRNGTTISGNDLMYWSSTPTTLYGETDPAAFNFNIFSTFISPDAVDKRSDGSAIRLVRTAY